MAPLRRRWPPAHSVSVAPEPYWSYAESILMAMAKPALFTTEADVARAVWQAVHDNTGRAHFPAGADAEAIMRQA